MGEVLEMMPPASVEFDGQALAAVSGLSRIAKDLAEITNGLREVAEVIEGPNHATLVSNIARLDEVIRMMTAIDETVTVLEANVEEIISFVGDGNSGFFVYGDCSVRIMVRGSVNVCKRTIRLQQVKLVDTNNDNNLRGASGLRISLSERPLTGITKARRRKNS